MSATPLSQDAPVARVGTVRALARLIEYARPALPAIIAGMVAALLSQLVALAIPQVLQSIVDGPLADGDASAIWPLAGLVFGLGVLEAAMVALRRWFVLTPGTRVEARMRNALYAKLQDLPVSFHDRWPSGQLLSRAVSDLGLIRRWLSFGLVLLVVNLIVIIVGLGILVSMSWMLGIVFLVCSIPLWVVGLPIRGPLLRGVAVEPGPGGRPRDGRRGVGARHPGPQGLRARQARPVDLPRAGGVAAEHRDREVAARGEHLGVDPARAGRGARGLPRARRLARLAGRR